MPEWDAIIVGGGTAGAMLAARYSEDPDRRVLLLEAGRDYRGAETPEEFRDRRRGLGMQLAAPPVMRTPDFYWLGITARRAQGQEPWQYRRGRGLGGCSTVNGLYAIRGIPSDFDHWRDLGAEGWGHEEILRDFVDIEADHDFADRPFHGGDGAMPVYREPEPGWGGVDRAVRDAALDSGYAWHPDHNDPDSTGVSPFAMNIRDGLRVSTNHAYLDPARERQNLTIRGDAHVDRVLFSGDRAVGVVEAGGAEHRLGPRGEVILSAGAAHSPAMLWRSGIGPRAELAALGVDVVADLPVGLGLQDHAVTFVESPVRESAQTSVGNRPTNIIVRTSSGLDGGRPNDLILSATNHNYWFGDSTAGIAISLAQPQSTGHMTLASTDPRVDPHFELRMLSDPRDLARMREGIERALELARHDAMSELRTGPVRFPETDSEILAQVKDTMHLTSTVRMGAADDDDAAVDPDLRVRGVRGLRVVDASVMPTVVSANTFLSVLAIASRFHRRNPDLGSVAL